MECVCARAFLGVKVQGCVIVRVGCLQVTKTEVKPGTRYLQVDVMATEKDDPDAEIELPPVRLRLV